MGRWFRCVACRAGVLVRRVRFAPVRAAEPVDLLLVLAADVSRSVDSQKFQLQREGYAAALANPRVLDAIRPAVMDASACCFSNGRDLATRRS